MKNEALVIIDVQEGVFKLRQTVHGGQEVIRNITLLMSWAHQQGIPVYLFQHENNTFLKQGSEDWRMISALPIVEGDQILHKSKPSIFSCVEFEKTLMKAEIHQFYVAGLISNGCVKFSGKEALKKGYEVIWVTDAHSTFYKNATKIIASTNEEMKADGAILKSTEEIIGQTV